MATAIATSPRVVVADEPTFGQDSRTWAELVELLADLRDAGCGLLLVTHDEALVDGPRRPHRDHDAGAAADERAACRSRRTRTRRWRRFNPVAKIARGRHRAWSGCC